MFERYFKKKKIIRVTVPKSEGLSDLMDVREIERERNKKKKKKKKCWISADFNPFLMHPVE